MGMSSTSGAHQSRTRSRHFPHALTAQVWVENPPVEPVVDNTRGTPVVLRLLPTGFHAERVKLSRLSVVSPPNLWHQSPTFGSAWITTGSDQADTKMAKLDESVRNPMSMSKKTLKNAQPRW